jgi:two-component system, NarL family, invasion response regulator UvrY
LAFTVDFTPAAVNADGEMTLSAAFSLRGAEGPRSSRRLKSVQVLIVDDHPIIVSGCRALLEGEPEIEVVEAQDGAAGFAAYFNHKPDVGVIDINLPGYSGLELLRRILEREPDARLVIFSMNDDPTVAARAIEAGAKGYIAKNDDPALFADAIKAVANGGRYLHPEMARRIAFLRADPSPDAVSNLSARELEILRLLAAGRTMAQIADLLNVSYKTIANNCTQLKQKLGARSAMDLMRIAIDARS